MIVDRIARLNTLRVILASASPRRKEILTTLGLRFEVEPSRFEETLDKSQFAGPDAYVLENAKLKALDVCTRMSDQDYDLVIGSDTIVVQDGQILEKPVSEAHAFEMLSALSGRSNTVMSAVALYTRCGPGGSLALARLFCEQTQVFFAELSPALIWSYIKTQEPMDKAGAYGIQGVGGCFVERIVGDYFAVMGLPQHRLCKELAALMDEGQLEAK
ncbi:N-acetylserotonin O-methyltransferase-like protein [Porphyridium purpureum]|uniref:N-acetylserotonin O-methyltransferase-like protein n=1 Tax=Porphyridium purpureum TaxID=35688 RepID=A0A5J4YRH2_PORPP|nr:N-acetylserotonin O-methyltransferase-like protein [Porphyridium purpureum]|eukprot:POR2277..scf229_5